MLPRTTSSQNPEDGSWVPKHIGVLICVVYILSQNVFVRKHVDCRNRQVVSNKNFANTEHLKHPKTTTISKTTARKS